MKAVWTQNLSSQGERDRVINLTSASSATHTIKFWFVAWNLGHSYFAARNTSVCCQWTHNKDTRTKSCPCNQGFTNHRVSLAFMKKNRMVCTTVEEVEGGMGAGARFSVGS